MVMPAMQLAAKVPDVYLQLWSASLLKGILFCSPFSMLKGKPIKCYLVASSIELKSFKKVGVKFYYIFL